MHASRIFMLCLAAGLMACQSSTSDTPSDPATSTQTENVSDNSSNGKQVAQGSAKERAEAQTEERIRELNEEVNVYSAYKYLETHPDFSLFFKVLSDTHMPKPMHSGSLTVIAPTNKAMEALPEPYLTSLLAVENKVMREEFVARHILETAYPSEKLDQFDDLNSMDGARLHFESNGVGDIEVNGVSFPRMHIQAGKSIVIATDEILPDGRNSK